MKKSILFLLPFLAVACAGKIQTDVPQWKEGDTIKEDISYPRDSGKYPFLDSLVYLEGYDIFDVDEESRLTFQFIYGQVRPVTSDTNGFYPATFITCEDGEIRPLMLWDLNPLLYESRYEPIRNVFFDDYKDIVDSVLDADGTLQYYHAQINKFDEIYVYLRDHNVPEDKSETVLNRYRRFVNRQNAKHLDIYNYKKNIDKYEFKRKVVRRR